MEILRWMWNCPRFAGQHSILECTTIIVTTIILWAMYILPALSVIFSEAQEKTSHLAKSIHLQVKNKNGF